MNRYSKNIQTRKKKLLTLICDKRCYHFHITEDVSPDTFCPQKEGNVVYLHCMYNFLGTGRFVIFFFFFSLLMKRKSALFHVVAAQCLLMCHCLKGGCRDRGVGHFSQADKWQDCEETATSRLTWGGLG